MKADIQSHRSHYKTALLVGTSISLVATVGDLIYSRARLFSSARKIAEPISMIGFPGLYLATLLLWTGHGGVDSPAARVLSFLLNAGFYSSLALGFRKLWRTFVEGSI
jgi:hypothetical protein